MFLGISESQSSQKSYSSIFSPDLEIFTYWNDQGLISDTSGRCAEWKDLTEQNIFVPYFSELNQRARVVTRSDLNNKKCVFFDDFNRTYPYSVNQGFFDGNRALTIYIVLKPLYTTSPGYRGILTFGDVGGDQDILIAYEGRIKQAIWIRRNQSANLTNNNIADGTKWTFLAFREQVGVNATITINNYSQNISPISNNFQIAPQLTFLCALLSGTTVNTSPTTFFKGHIAFIGLSSLAHNSLQIQTVKSTLENYYNQTF